MTFVEALTAAILALLMREDPRIAREPERQAKWLASVSQLTPLHAEVGARGLLVSPQVDALLTSSVNYAETRFRLPAPSGDCYQTHPYRNVPSLRWPRGYVPKMRWVCPSIGPMNVAQNNRFVVHTWPEVVTLIPGLSTERLTVEQMKNPKTNIQLGYGILAHWKSACPNKKAPAAPASWLTAYRWGRCTPQHHNKRYFDPEARKRCERVNFMIEHMKANTELSIPSGWSCLPKSVRSAVDPMRSPT